MPENLNKYPSHLRRLHLLPDSAYLNPQGARRSLLLPEAAAINGWVPLALLTIFEHAKDGNVRNLPWRGVKNLFDPFGDFAIGMVPMRGVTLCHEERMKMTNLNYLTPKQAAAYLNLSVKTLEKWRHEGKGPSFKRFGNRKIMYSVDDLQSYADSNTFSSTSEV